MTPRHAVSRRRQLRARRVLAKRILGGNDIWKKLAADACHVRPRNVGGEGCGKPGAAGRRRGAWGRLYRAQEARRARLIREMAERLRLRELNSEDAREFLDEVIAMGFE